MATLLLVVIYLSFISLGVPDSLLGTAWPVLYRELGVPLASQSAVSILCSLATMTSSMNSARIISHLGTGKVTAFSTLLTAAALLGFSVTQQNVGAHLELGFGDGAQRVFGDGLGAHLGQLPLGHIRVNGEQRFSGDQFEHRITEEFEAFVVLGPLMLV